MDKELSVRETECEWDPNKHHGKPCPTHQGGTGEFDNKEISLSAYETTEKLKSRISRTNDKQWKYFQELNDKLPDSALKIFDKLSYKYFTFFVVSNTESDKNGERGSSYNRNLKRVSIEKQFLEKIDEDKSSYLNGQVLYHELGHCIDNVFSIKGWSYLSSTYKSKINGMTLQDTIKKERRKFGEGIISDISINVMASYQEKAIEEIGKEKLDFFDKVYEEVDEEIKRSDFDKWDKYVEAKIQLRNEKFEKKFPGENYSESYKKRESLLQKGTKKFIHEYYTLSDIASSKWYETSAYGSKNKGFGLGHSEYYYQMRPLDGLGAEFFANMYSSLCLNNKNDIENTRKYFPESVQIFEELIEEIAKK